MALCCMWRRIGERASARRARRRACNWCSSCAARKRTCVLSTSVAPASVDPVASRRQHEDWVSSRRLTRDLDALARHRVLAFRGSATRRRVLYATHVFQGLDGWATDVLRVRRGSCVVEDAPLKTSRGRCYGGATESMLWIPPPPPPVEPPSTKLSTNLPAGWASRRANTLEGGFGRARLDDGVGGRRRARGRGLDRA